MHYKVISGPPAFVRGQAHHATLYTIPHPADLCWSRAKVSGETSGPTQDIRA